MSYTNKLSLAKSELYPFQNKTVFFFVCVCLQYQSFENTVGKGEIAHNE